MLNLFMDVDKLDIKSIFSGLLTMHYDCQKNGVTEFDCHNVVSSQKQFNPQVNYFVYKNTL